MTSMFDPAIFLDATITEPSIKRPPLPAGAVFTATIGDVKPRTWQGKEDKTKSGVVVDVPLKIDCSTIGGGMPPEITLTDGIMLDINDAGAIDNAPGKNAKLRRYRESLDMNKSGDVFSFRMMTGRMIKVKIKHRMYEGETYDEVDSVAKA